MKHSDIMRNRKLERDSNTKKYYLLDTSTGKRTYMKDSNVHLLPERGDQKILSGAMYLLNVLGYKVTDFTTAPSGYFFQMENEGLGDSLCGLSIAPSPASVDLDDPKSLPIPLQYLLERIDEACNKKIFAGVTDDERRVIEGIREGLGNTCLVEIALRTNASIKELGCDNLKGNAEAGLQAYKQKNDSNCNNNHIILAEIIKKKIGIPESVDVASSVDSKLKDGTKLTAEEAMFKVVRDRAMSWILSGYFEYSGRDRAKGMDIPINRDILNQRAIESIRLFGNESDANAVMNMCSTDYSADMIQRSIETMTIFEPTSIETKEEDVLRTFDAIVETLAVPENNMAKKRQARTEHKKEATLVEEGTIYKNLTE